MKQSDVIVTVNDIDQYSEDNRQLDQKLNDLKSQQADKEAKQAQINKYIQKQKSQRQQIDNDIEQLNYNLIKATEEYEKFTGRLNVLEERKRNQSETNARFEEELDNLHQELKMLIMKKRYYSTNYCFKRKQKELNNSIHQLESQLYVSDEQHDEKLESIKMNTMN